MSSPENIQNNLDCQVSANGQFKNENVVLKPCHICGRTFNPQSLARHEKVCEKTKKCIRRNVFNSFSQRAKEIGAVSVSNDAKEEDKKKCIKWKEEHENIMRVMRGDRSSSVMNNGLSQQKKVPSGYEQCPACNRCFNQKAADRHIVWCLEQQNRMPKTPPNSQAVERLKARVKYQAPLPKKKINNDTRLVKSAETIRLSSMLRTHSSPSISIRDIRPSKQSLENSCTPVLKSNSLKKIDKNVSVCANNNVNQELNSVVTDEALPQNKKAVKFKEIFPVYKKDRNKNLDMLAALRLRLSELGTSDDILDDCFVKPNENELFGNHPSKCNFSNAAYSSRERETWTSDGEVHCSPSSSSDGSFPSIGGAGNAEQRMPRFCYNCGTKYPIVSAKFCCECGARRFIFGDNNQLYAS